MPPYHLVDATSWEQFVYFALASVVGLLAYGYDCHAGAHGFNRLPMIAL